MQPDVKSVYAEVAREHFTPKGDKAADSRVAIITGLTRKGGQAAARGRRRYQGFQ